MDSAQIERVSLFNLLIAYGGKLATTQILESLNVSRKTALRIMVEFKAIGLVDIEDFHEPRQNNLSKRIVLNSRLNWLVENSMITKILPHTLPFFLDPSGGNGHAEDDDSSDASSNGEDMEDGFWPVYDRLEKLDLDKNIVNHKKLHEALVSSGKFYAGDATQIISDMVKAGKLKMVSFHSYRKVP